MSNCMTFKLGSDGFLSFVDNSPLISKSLKEVPNVPLLQSERIEKKSILNRVSNMGNLGKSYSLVPIPFVLATAVDISGAGVCWDAFMKYIFPHMLDIAKVFCALKIAQGFYQEKRGGRDEGTGFGSVVTYGKWYLIFWLVPFFVELIDQVGLKMISDFN